MSLPWFPVMTKWTLTQRQVRMTDGREASFVEAACEINALAHDGLLATMPLSKMAASLGWSRGKLRRFVASFPGADGQQTDIDWPSWWTANSRPQGHRRSTANSKRTANGQQTDLSRALSLQRTEKELSLSDLSSDDSPELTVWKHWQQWHPKARKLRTSDARSIRSRIRDDDVETCKLVAEWVHLAPDASFFRGDNERRTPYTSCGTLYKADKWSMRVERAQQWARAGKPKVATGGREEAAEAIWDQLCAIVDQGRSLPRSAEDLQQHGISASSADLVWQVLGSLPGGGGKVSKISQARTQYERRDLRMAFITGYRQAASGLRVVSGDK